MGFLTLFLEPKKHDIEIEKQDTPDGYRELAARAGFAHVEAVLVAATQKAAASEFAKFLAGSGITVYSEKAVARYMWSITPSDHSWRWLDVSSLANYGGGYGPYTKPIPEAVLMTMAKIREPYPNAFFQATDIYQLPKGDPFLRVTIDGKTWFIIERWDEPKFRM